VLSYKPEKHTVSNIQNIYTSECVTLGFLFSLPSVKFYQNNG